MSSQLESIYSDELFLLAETLGEVKTRTEKLEGEFSTHAKPLEAATNALSAALSGIKALQFHVLDNNLGALSARVEEMRKAVDEQVGVIALELKKADETNAAKAGADAEALRFEILALESQLESLVTQFGQQLERVEFAAKEEAKKLQLIPGPAGAAGASLNPRGTFIDGETYNRLDVVSWLGSSYIATVDGVTEKPSKNSNQWQTLASRGGGGAGGVGDFGSLAGVAQINQGGTGQTTRALALNALLPDQAGSTQYMLLTDGSGTVSWGAQPVAGLPSQTSNSGRLLTTNGSTASWSNAVTVSGSNATVGGTLSITGQSNFAGGTTYKVDTNGDIYVRQLFSGANGTDGVKITQSGTGIGIIASIGNGGLRLQDSGNVQLMNLAHSTGVVSIPSTTASNNTSSGALVVSGGVGVAKEVYVGTTLKLANTSQSVTAWGDIGAQLSVAGAVITDTSSSGTVSRAVVNSIAASALAASSTTTYTQAASLFVAGAPTANTNVTITNAYAIYTAGGRINFQGLPTSSAGLQAGTLWNDGGTLKVA